MRRGEERRRLQNAKKENSKVYRKERQNIAHTTLGKLNERTKRL